MQSYSIMTSVRSYQQRFRAVPRKKGETVVSLLLCTSFSTMFAMRNVILISSLVQHVVLVATELYLSTIANTQDCTSQMLLWTTIKQKNLQICIDHAPACIYFCKKKCIQERIWLHISFHNHNYQGGTGKFIYKAST